MGRELCIFLVDATTLTSSGFAGFKITAASPPSRRKVLPNRRENKKSVLMHFAWGERFCQYRCCDRKLLLQDTIWIRGHRGPCGRVALNLNQDPAVTNKLLALRALPGRSRNLFARRTDELSHSYFSTAIYLQHPRCRINLWYVH